MDVHVIVPKNVVGGEMIMILCKRYQIPFMWVEPVEPNNPQWRTKQDKKGG
jgi:hypothetical protein